MKNEMYPLIGNGSWELTKLLKGKKALHNKLVYQVKNEHDDSKRYKTRLVDKDMLTKGITHDKLGLYTISVGLLA